MLEEPELREIVSVEDAGGTAIEAEHSADWTIVAFGRAWITGYGGGLAVYDAASGDRIGGVRVTQGPCRATDAGFGAVWTATCTEPGLARIDPRTLEVTGTVNLELPDDTESSIGAGEGAVWAITDGDDCIACVVVGVDPDTMEVARSFDVRDGANAVRAGLGGVWVTYFYEDTVVHLDPVTGEIVATIPVASGPRFFDVGAGGVWVMAQSAGALCHIDASTDALVGCTTVDRLGVEGGDLTVGDDLVVFRGSDELVALVDAATGEITQRIGEPQGSGSASLDDGQLWISAHDVATVYHVPLGT
jgi:streptogramin lyase